MSIFIPKSSLLETQIYPHIKAYSKPRELKVVYEFSNEFRFCEHTHDIGMMDFPSR